MQVSYLYKLHQIYSCNQVHRVTTNTIILLNFLLGALQMELCLVSELYMGSISDVELIKVSGYLETLDNKNGISVMADRGFTIRDILGYS